MSHEHDSLEAQLAARAEAAPEPPRELRGRVLAAVHDELAAEPMRVRSWWLGAVAAAAAVVLALNVALVAGESASAGFMRRAPGTINPDSRQPTLWSVRQGMLGRNDDDPTTHHTPRRPAS